MINQKVDHNVTAGEGETVQAAGSVGIVVIHGVQPHPRYEIQDEFAQQLAEALNGDERWNRAGKWVADPVNPQNREVAKDFTPEPRLTRVHIFDDDSSKPKRVHFDVYEAYWSPLDKGMSAFRSVVGWLIRSLFLPLNTTARYGGTAQKARRDFAFLIIALVLTLALLGAAFYAALKALSSLAVIAGNGKPVEWSIALDPTKIATLFTTQPLVLIVIGFLGAYFLAQASYGVWSMATQRSNLPVQPGVRRLRIALIVLVSVLAVILLALAAVLPTNAAGIALGCWAVAFALAGLLFQGFRMAAQSFFVNFFQDVQIYTARDQNSKFYGVREQIITLATRTILQICGSGAQGDRPYERIYVLGHSLGSTIALDAIMRCYSLALQDPSLLASFKRIRALITFGTALEKTKYFFDVTNPSPSLALDQWNSDAYGALLTDDQSYLDDATTAGIFWANYWYFDDPICDAIDSYRSFLPVGTDIALSSKVRSKAKAAAEAAAKLAADPAAIPATEPQRAVGRLLARNEQGTQTYGLPYVIPHGKYLADPWFWASTEKHIGVLDIVARRVPPQIFEATLRPTGAVAGIPEPTVVAVDSRTAMRYIDRY